ncbi:MAG: biotin/lipoyl-containing protein [Bacillota bacterium]
MRKYLVNVNGTSYEVMVEEINGAIPAAPVAAAPVAPAAPVVSAPAAPVAAPAVPAAPVSAACGETISAPMPGTILSVSVKQGDTVKKGQVLMVLEAMKMENEIVSPKDGVIASVSVCAGTSVNTGVALCVIG